MLETHIVSTRPLKCLDFYTRVLLLKRIASLELDVRVAQAVPGERFVFRLRTGSIELLDVRPPLTRRASANAAADAEQAGFQEFYFLVQQPVEGIRAHLQREGWADSAGPVLYTGKINALRVLREQDPDGNRLRLVEVCG